MPRECLCIKADGTSEFKMIPTEEEIEQENNEKYNDTIWKHRPFGTMIRVSGWSSGLNVDGYYDYKVYFHRKGFFGDSMNMTEFNLIYERVGKAKYSKEQIEKMEFELGEDR